VLYVTDVPENELPDEEESDAAEQLEPPVPDFTLEILMSKLSAPARRPFFVTEDTAAAPEPRATDPSPHHSRGQSISKTIGIADLFPASLTILDAYAFEPCGYSSNALIRHGSGEGYYTIHVTPEEGWSYASFECNVPVSTTAHESQEESMPDLQTLIQRVVKIFQPGHLTVTLFTTASPQKSSAERPQQIFSKALTGKASGFNYKRVDKIDYEFGGYNLAFASFERRAGWDHQADWSIISP